MTLELLSAAGLPLLERDKELDAVEQLLRAVAEGRGAVLLIEGPAGVGKSTLLSALSHTARTRRLSVLAAHATELGRDIPFGVARRLLAPAVRAAPHVLDGGLSQIARPVFDGSGSGTGGGAGLPLAEALIALVGELPDAPVLLVVDDAQWADAGSLLFLADLAARLDEVPVGIAVSIRTGEEPTDAALLDRLRLAPGARVLRPAPLSARAVVEVVREGLPTASESFADLVAQATAGNPLLVAEMVETARARGAEAAAGEVEAADVTAFVPDAVTRSTLLRLQPLGAPARALAEAVAVLEEGPLARAALLAGLTAAEADAAADALADRHILTAGEPVRFEHPLIAAAIAASIRPFARARLHRRAAGLLSADGVPDDAVAAHLLLARPESDPWTVAVLRRAAALALGRGEPRIAARLLARAVAEPPVPEARGAMLVEQAQAEAAAGDPAAIDRFRAALANVEAPARRTAAWHELSRLLWNHGDFAAAAAAAAQGRAELGPDAPGAELLLADELASAMSVPELAAGAAAETERLVRATADGRPPTEPTLLAQLVLHLAWRGIHLDLVPALARAAVADDPLVDPTGHGVPAQFVTGALTWVDELDASIAMVEAAIERAVKLGDPLAEVSLRLSRAWQYYFTGDLLAAEDLLGRVLAGGLLWHLQIGLAAQPLAMVRLERGDVSGARAAIDVGTSANKRTPGNGWVICRVLMAEGDSAAALATILAEGELYERHLLLDNPGAVPWRSDAAVAAHRLGDSEHARELADAELARARQLGVPRALGGALRVAGLVRGGEEGLALLAEALEVLERSPSRLELLRTLVDYGAALRRAGRRGEARELLARAVDTGDRTGAIALAERAREELRASGARPRRRAISGPDALTPAERRVAELAAAGRSTPQIARVLFVSRKTVESQLGSVFRKLGVSSRREIAPRLQNRQTLTLD